MFDGCSLCGCERELKIIGDPMDQVPGRIWEVMLAASLLDRGIDAKPEVGSWGDQPAAWCSAVEYVLSERARMSRAAEQAELDRLTG
jgi:hypothetical protein